MTAESDTPPSVPAPGAADAQIPPTRQIPLTRPSVGERELEAVRRVLDSGWLAGQGPVSAEVERQVARLSDRAHAVAVNSGTAALHLALLGLGIGPGDEVIVADYTFPATGHAVLMVGARPVFADVHAATGTVDPFAVQSLIGPRTRAVIAVDALGLPADWQELTDLAARHELPLIEDAACSLGGTYRGRPCGAFGDVAIFSLHARKGVTSGEGGLLVTDDAELAGRARRLANFGMSEVAPSPGAGIQLPAFTDLGYNYKLADLLAAVALPQLERIDDLLARRRTIAARYAELLRDCPGVEVPVVPDDRTHTWQTFAVTLDPRLNRNRIVEQLRQAGVGCTIGTYASHREPVYGESRACPRSGELVERHLALPMFPELSAQDQSVVVAELRRLIRGESAGSWYR